MGASTLPATGELSRRRQFLLPVGAAIVVLAPLTFGPRRDGVHQR